MKKTRGVNTFLQSAMNAGRAQDGHGEKSFQLFRQMQQIGETPNRKAIISILNACSSPESMALGKQVHALIIDREFESDVVLLTALLTMYAKCGSIEDARQAFSKMRRRDVVAWTAMIAACSRNGHVKEGFNLFQLMLQEGVKPNAITFISILKGCSRQEDLALGKLVHKLLADSAIESDVVVGTALVTMYGKCGSIEDARRVFSKMRLKNVVSWTAMIAACARHGYDEEACTLFHQMQLEGVKPNQITFACIMDACSSPESLALGKQVHAQIISRGVELDVVVSNALITMYSNCGSMRDAWRVFSKMCQRDVVSWTAMIAACAEHNYIEEAFKLFYQMQLEGVQPNKITFISILNACSSPEALALGKQVHTLIVASALESDVIVGTSLVSMYDKCGSFDDAKRIFGKIYDRDVVSWNAMIAACGRHRHGEEAFKVFKRMQQEGVKPDQLTFINILCACSSMKNQALGKQIHLLIADSGFDSDEVVGNALVSMYGNCGNIEEARRVFNNIRPQGVISWNAMIGACVQHGRTVEAIKLFHKMQQEGVGPDKITFISVLRACTSLAVLSLGKQVHAHIVDCGIESDVVVGTALVNMYSKCGSFKDAWRMFNKINHRNVVLWTVMISACAQHGCGKEALQLFEQMQKEGTKPDGITLTSLLSACSHSRLVDEGLHHFKLMRGEYGIIPTVEHCNCIVDLLGRAGRVNEAEEFIRKMPCKSNAVTWMTLLGSCRIYGCIEQGKHAAESALQLDPQCTSAYVVLSNIYAAAGRWDDVAKVRKMMVDRGAKKEPGCSWIEVNNRVHTFLVGDRSHPRTAEIYAKLKNLSEQMKEAGYVADRKLVLHDVEEEQKEELLFHHSEKLAIAFGLISLKSQSSLRIMKNLRVCPDCHIASKFISKIASREIILRDANRFHHFKDGVCSCGDYW